jgi:hypothetical protein
MFTKISLKDLDSAFEKPYSRPSIEGGALHRRALSEKWILDHIQSQPRAHGPGFS